MADQNLFVKNVCRISTFFLKKIDTLFQYYNIAKKAVLDEHQRKKEKFKVNFLISNKLDSLFKVSEEDRNDEIQKVLDFPISKSHVLGDVITSIEFKNKSELTLSYNAFFENVEKYDPNKAKSINSELNYLLKMNKTSTLSNLMITFESFLAFIYDLLIRENEEKYFEGKTVPLKDIINFSSQNVIEREISFLVEKDMYDSNSLLTKIFEKEKIDTSNIHDLLESFNEVYCRRNIYVHNNGFANERYIKDVKSTKHKVGDYLKCDDSYIECSFNIVQKVILFICASLLNKTKPDGDTYQEIFDYSFALLKEKKYNLCEFIYGLLYSSNSIENVDRLISLVNLLICYRDTKDKEKFDCYLKKFDTSGADSGFIIAKLVLESKFKEAYELILETYDKLFTPKSLVEWPLYSEFRKTEYFNNIKKSHEDDFTFIELENNNA